MFGFKQVTTKSYLLRLGNDQMANPSENFSAIFTHLSRRSTDCTTTIRRRDVGEEKFPQDFLRQLLASDALVWTDVPVPSTLGAGDAGVYAACKRCLSYSSLSKSTGPISSSFSAESLALVHGLE